MLSLATMALNATKKSNTLLSTLSTEFFWAKMTHHSAKSNSIRVAEPLWVILTKIGYLSL
jgi:hypothetical protein